MDDRELPGAGEPLRAESISGGASNEIYRLERGGCRMVLRRPPREVPEGRNRAMLREYRVLAALADSDVPHARALASCEDPEVLGACFYIMEFVDGWTPMGELPPPFDKDLEARLGVAHEEAHGGRRILHAKGDTAGRAIMGALVEAARNSPSIDVLEGWTACDRLNIGVGVRNTTGGALVGEAKR